MLIWRIKGNKYWTFTSVCFPQRLHVSLATENKPLSAYCHTQFRLKKIKKRLINIISYYDIIFEMNNPIIWQLQLLEWLGKKLTLRVYNWLIIVFYKTKTWRYEVDLKWKSRKPAERDVFGPTLRTLMWVPVPGTTGPINQPGTSVTQFQCYKTSSH